MFNKNLIIAWRNLVKNKMHSFINIIGLAAGMTVAILIGLWLHDELSFDRNFDHYDRLGQVYQNVTNNGEVQTWTNMPYPLAEELRTNYGDNFKHVVMVGNRGGHMLQIGDKKLTMNGGYFEKDAPELLSLKMVAGSRDGLTDQTSLFLSASAAKAWFGDEDPVNKAFVLNGNQNVKVTGVFEDLPVNSTFADLKMMGTWEIFYNYAGVKNMTDPWRPNAFSIFVQIADNTSFADVSASIKDAKLKKVNEQLAKKKPELFIHPMSKWHLYSEFRDGKNIGGAIQYVWMFGIIGVFVLLLACINFMNLTTARSEKRAKEVGIRKTVGSSRGQLIFQFFNESLVTVMLALTISLALAQLALPFFNTVAEKKMHILWTNPLFWLACLGFAMITCLLAGSYPALYLSSFKPLTVLKGIFKAGRYAALPRKVLVVVQFSVSVILIIGTIIIYQQIQFAKDRPVGYSRDGLISMPLSQAVHEHFDAVQTELKQANAIVSMATAGSPTTEIWSSTSGIDWDGKDPNLSTDFSTVGISYDYGKTIGWEFSDGRDLSRDFGTDTSAILLNEAAVKYIGFKTPVGQTIRWWGVPLKVIGVVKNLIVQNPYTEVRPIIYHYDGGRLSVVLLKLNPELNAKESLSKIETVFKRVSPDSDFDYKFVDAEYARKFGNEERISKLARIFAVLAILISCLGLFGLASFVAEQRTKEIGIRKVVGASVFNLWKLLSVDFVILVTISSVIAIPVAYFYMHRWLQKYDYHTDMSWTVFIGAIVGAITITLLTVSYQAIKAAVANPVRSLRTE